MPSFPPIGFVTICEINRDLITAESLSDDQAKQTYGKFLGHVFSPVTFETNFLESPETEYQNNLPRKDFSATLKSLLSGSLSSLQLFSRPVDEKLLREFNLCGLSWHQHKHILAFISGPNHVTIRDYEDSERKQPCILTHDSQIGVKVVEWRPNGGKMLSVACKGGICIWAASYPGNLAAVRTGITSGSVARGSGTRWTLVDFLRSPDDVQISALSWSPDGRYLASASCEDASFIIWDISQGLGTPCRRGLGGISILKWSPTGDYFFAAKFDGTFYLWETNTWTSELWSSTSGFVTGAAWDPDGHMILITFSESSTLGIEKVAWDSSGERLALSYKDGDELYKGLVAIYDVRRTPLISASLVGFIRGPGENPKPVAFSFHDKFKLGSLLSVCWSSGVCCSYPLIFRSHVLP